MKIDDLFSIDGKVALVTGGSRGIGEMIAAGFLANGARVYISSRKADACAATAARLVETYGGECVALPADLSGLDGAASLVGASNIRFGAQAIDYFAADQPSPLLPLWSIGVEEQFYLFWPLVLAIVLVVFRLPVWVLAMRCEVTRRF